jgi:hypothetical protein
VRPLLNCGAYVCGTVTDTLIAELGMRMFLLSCCNFGAAEMEEKNAS